MRDAGCTSIIRTCICCWLRLCSCWSCCCICFWCCDIKCCCWIWFCWFANRCISAWISLKLLFILWAHTENISHHNIFHNSIIFTVMKPSTNCVMDWRYCSGSIFSMSGVRLVSMNGALPSCSNHLCSTSRTSSLISYIRCQKWNASERYYDVTSAYLCVILQYRINARSYLVFCF